MLDDFDHYYTGHVKSIGFEFKHKNWKSNIVSKINFDSDDRVFIVVGLNGSAKSTFMNTVDDFFRIFNGLRDDTSIDKFKNECILRGVSSFKFIIDWYELIDDINYLEIRLKKIISSKKFFDYYGEQGYFIDVLNVEDSFEEYKNKLDDLEFYKKMEGLFYALADFWLDTKFECFFDFENEDYLSKLQMSFGLESQIESDSFNPILTKFELDFPNEPFGPFSWREQERKIHEKIYQDTGYKLANTGFLNLKGLTSTYVSAQDISESPPIRIDEFFDAIKQGSDDAVMEEYLLKLPPDSLINKLGIRRNEENDFLRNYSEYPHDESNGSDEFIEYDADFLSRSSSDVTYFQANEVFVCDVKSTSIISAFDFLRKKINVHRWQNRVIFDQRSYKVYSKSEDDLLNYMTRDFWRYCDMQSRSVVVSKIFEVEHSKTLALMHLEDFGDVSESKYLTSGQKRLFTLFLKAATTNTMLFMVDEPEISLHIDWQRRVIDTIASLSFSPYLIFASHSPDIIFHHLDKVIDFSPQLTE